MDRLREYYTRIIEKIEKDYKSSNKKELDNEVGIK